jgi:hypothetical protein
MWMSVGTVRVIRQLLMRGQFDRQGLSLLAELPEFLVMN